MSSVPGCGQRRFGSSALRMGDDQEARCDAAPAMGWEITPGAEGRMGHQLVCAGEEVAGDCAGDRGEGEKARRRSCERALAQDGKEELVGGGREAPEPADACRVKPSGLAGVFHARAHTCTHTCPPHTTAHEVSRRTSEACLNGRTLRRQGAGLPIPDALQMGQPRFNPPLPPGCRCRPRLQPLHAQPSV